MASPAAVYAKALFESAQKGNKAGACAQGLAAVWEHCSANAPLRAVLCEAGTSSSIRQGIVADVAAALSLDDLSRRFLLLLAARGRLAELPQILRELQRLTDRSVGVSAGELRSAVELSAEELQVLTTALAKRVGTKVRLAQKTDPSLLGGFVASVAGKTYDASLKNQLERFKSELI